MLRRTVVSCITVAITGAGLLTGYAGAASTSAAGKTYELKAALRSKSVVPAPKRAGAARGTFSAKLSVNGKKSSFVWQLRLSHLTSKVAAAHIHFGAAGKTGPVALPLCVRCRLTAHGAYNGSYVANPQFLKAILHGGAYVDVHTKKNPKGEIRGQIKVASA